MPGFVTAKEWKRRAENLRRAAAESRAKGETERAKEFEQAAQDAEGFVEKMHKMPMQRIRQIKRYWTEDEVRRLLAYRAEGLTFRECAERIGWPSENATALKYKQVTGQRP